VKETKRIKKEINIVSLLMSIFSVLFIVGGALLIFYFSRGYRINISERNIKKTGVLTVQTEPSMADLYINGDDVGKTPKSRTLDIGTNSITVKKEGYRDWNKQVEIVEEKSTLLFPFLIFEQITPSSVWENTGEVEKAWISDNEAYFVFLIKDEIGQRSLWTYRINSPIWNLNPNPVQILTVTEEQDIDLVISHNGQKAIMTLTEEGQENYYIVDLTVPILPENLEPITIPEITESTLSWSRDNRYIILESTTEISSIDTTLLPNVEEPNILVTKEPDVNYIWNTDEEGFFYILEDLHTEEDGTYTYALKQMLPNGGSPNYTIDKTYFQKQTSYIDYYRENGDSYPEFTTSPQATQAIGKITYFEVNQELNGVYIKTETSVYWYDITTDKYRMICTHPAELISFSPDSRKVLFVNNNNYYIFTLKKEEADHTEEIGTKKVKNITKEDTSQISWLSNSTYLYYVKDNKLQISEKDGENQMELLDMKSTLLHTIMQNREYIITLENDPEKIAVVINQYRLK
jgi:hypothetical protein